MLVWTSQPRSGTPTSKGGSALLTIVVALTVLLTAARAHAQGPTKQECIDAHSHGQDAREAGHLSLARKLFLTCAQSSCPGMVQGDCARFSDELERLQSSVTFVARDSSQADLPDTTVYVDGVLVATHLDDGKLHDVDPGSHTVRFLNGTREVSQTVVVNEGEKGRLVNAVFPTPGGTRTAPGNPRAEPPPVAEPRRPVVPLVVAGAGVAVLATGVVLGVVGLGQVPSTCQMSTHQCEAPPGDPTFTTAKNAVTLADIGLAAGIAGAAVTAGGLIWYFVSPRTITTGRGLTPWMTAHGGGIAFGGSL